MCGSIKYLLPRQAAARDPLFVARHGGRWTVDGIQSHLAHFGARVGVAHCHPHTFRRTCALWSLRAGMNIYALAALMGHSDLTVLRRYLALVDADLQQAHARHGPVDSALRRVALGLSVPVAVLVQAANGLPVHRTVAFALLRDAFGFR